MKNSFKLFFLSFSIFLVGCAQTVELSKTIWGSSTRVLEEARAEAIVKTYQCSFEACWDSILSIANKEVTEREALNKEKVRPFSVFKKDPVEGVIVVMGIPGNVNTTEVGIFFSKHSESAYTLEITSLSSIAKEKVAEAVFKELDLRFQVVK